MSTSRAQVLGVSVLTWRSPTARSIVQPIITAGTRTLRLSASGMRLSGSGTSTTNIATTTTTTSLTAAAVITTPATGHDATTQALSSTAEGDSLAAAGVDEAVGLDVVGGLRNSWRAVTTAVDAMLTLHVPMLLMYLPIQT